jgi:hypothetical protein
LGVAVVVRTLNVRMDAEVFDALERARIALMSDEDRLLDWEEFLKVVAERVNKGKLPK